MQWNRDGYNQQTNMQQDVYSDVATSFSTSQVAQDNQEFSLASIQERLGEVKVATEMETARSTPDLMPSSQTLNMSYQRQYASQTATATKMSAKTKVLVASYAVVVLALVLAVTLCSVSVGGAFTAVGTLNSQYSEVTSQVAALEEQINTEDYAALAERAAELGYIDASTSNTLTYDRLETRPAQNFNVQTNWFDQLCDWLSGAFGN